jgi:hypothetical protein
LRSGRRLRTLGSMNRRALATLVAAVVVCSLFASVAAAKDGRGEVRAAGVCGRAASSELRLRGSDRGIEVRFELDHNRAGVAWRVALVHERRVAWKGAATTTAPSGSFEIRRTVPDLPGADTVTATAWGPNGLVCRATATLPAD